MDRDCERKHGHADGAERDETIFDFSAGKQTSGVTADANANRKRRLQVAAVRFVNVQNLAAIKDNHKLQQRAEKPEVGVAHDSEMQSAIRPDNASLLYQIAKDVKAKFPGRISSGNMRDSETRRQPNQSASAEDEARINLVPMKALR